MSFDVQLTEMAAAEIRRGYSWLAERSLAAANRWRDSILAAVDSLAENPDRCPLAPEDEWYAGTLRQLLHGKRRSVYRILFEMRNQVVVILRVRHAAQDLLDADDL